ncbi:hypothetical protein SDC9_182735 [bioreactor metagenome]|uniref:Uncharacterized protein n=1 Tax=bioreactor metagenome TaxID=1076179 RepID=A0A645H8C9_9ZZZZ
MKHAGRHVPAGSGFEPVGFRQVGDPVVAFGEILQAGADLLLRGSRLKAEKGVGEASAVVVELRREIVALRFAALPDFFRVFVAVMHMVRQRSEVVEKFRVDRPAAAAVPEPFAEQFRAEFGDRFGERHEGAVRGHRMTDAFVHAGERPVVRRGGAGQPAFIDAATGSAQRVVIVGVQFDPAAGDAERARHPVRGKAQDAVSGGEGGTQFLGI